MILYHFTAKIFLDRIKSEGITLGATPIKFKGQQAFINAQQWLTKKKDFHQEWCEFSSLPYDRSECRLTIKIPKNFQKFLLSYTDYSKWLGGSKIDYFDKFDNGEFDKSVLDWLVYQGNIPKLWVKKVNFKADN